MFLNNKILVIDDKYEEALPVIEALARKGVSTIYWNGNVETRPQTPLKGIRFVFLDMRFSYVIDPHTINATLFTLMESAISTENGPYILFIWSKHDNEYLRDFKKELSAVSKVPKPYLIINMEKNKFVRHISENNEVYEEIASALEKEISEDFKQVQEVVLQLLQSNNIGEKNERIVLKENGIEELLTKLEKELNQINSLAILLMWENIVAESSQKLVNSIASFSKLDNNWDNNIKALIQNLAVANAGKGLGVTAKEYVINALSSFNQMLPDELWNQLIKQNIDEGKFSFLNEPSIKETIGENTYSISKPSKKFIIKKNNSDYTVFKQLDELNEIEDKCICEKLYHEYIKILGRSNFKLLCEGTTSTEMDKPGYLHTADDSNLLSSLCSAIFKDIHSINLEDITLIKLDISSSCDYAQDKLKRVRILPGIIIEQKYFSDISSTEDIYCTPELDVNNKIVKIAFNFHYINNQSKECFQKESRLFSFRELLLTEIKSKLSAYIARVGIINL